MRKRVLFPMLLILSLLAAFVAGCTTSATTESEMEATEVTEVTEQATSEVKQENVEATEMQETVGNEKRNETREDAKLIDLSNRVLQKSPKEDAAIVNSLEGFGTFQNESLTGKYSMQEGLVIRESTVADGKVHIPPSGLYYTIRYSNYNTNPFGENVLYLLGKKYHWVDFGFKLDVLTDAKYEKVGDKVPFGDGSKSLELTGLSVNSPGFNAPVATYSILKPSGNYYGSTFSVATDPKVMDATTGVLSDGSGRTTGTYVAGPDGKSWTQEYYSTSVAAGGATYLVGDEITKDQQIVKEFRTGAVDFLLFTEKDPIKMALAADEKSTLGDWEVQVVNIGENTATVKMLNTKTNEEIEKELGPLTDETTSRIPADQVQRSQFILRPESNDVQVILDIMNDPFAEAGKVKLVGFEDVIEMGNGVLFSEDDRFIYRPDT